VVKEQANWLEKIVIEQAREIEALVGHVYWHVIETHGKPPNELGSARSLEGASFRNIDNSLLKSICATRWSAVGWNDR
jgi:hypothetical protein